MNELAVRYTANDGTEVELNPETIARYVVTNGMQVTEPEMARFVAVCHARGMNPLAGDVHLVKYSQGSPASVIPSKDYYNRVCKSQPTYDGEEAGIIVGTRDGGQEYREGTAYAQGESILGGWARVHDKRWAHPTFVSVSYAEAAQSNGTWKRMPAWMIRKVALSRAQREAYPDKFEGTYDESEMPDAQAPIPVEAEVVKPASRIGEARKALLAEYAEQLARDTGLPLMTVKHTMNRPDLATMDDDALSEHLQGVASELWALVQAEEDAAQDQYAGAAEYEAAAEEE